MREFVVTAEMRDEAERDKREMMRLRDEMERAGFVFRGVDSFDLIEPHERVDRGDGSAVFRQWQLN